MTWLVQQYLKQTRSLVRRDHDKVLTQLASKSLDFSLVETSFEAVLHKDCCVKRVRHKLPFLNAFTGHFLRVRAREAQAVCCDFLVGYDFVPAFNLK